jgi:hypothetical protein
MVGRQSILALSTLLAAASVSTGNAEEWLNISDYQLTSVCSDTLKKYELAQFQIESKADYLPEVSLRDLEAELDIKDVFLGAGFDGLLFQRGERAVLHCFNQFYRPNFILLERSERWMIFESGARQATEAHIHSYISCGSNCGYSRYESITFFDDPAVPKEEEGMLHSRPVPPLYWLGGDTHPNEYPSRWFRSYLTEEERIVFDRIIDEG